MEQHTTTRRQIIAALAVLPMAATSTLTFAADNPDAEILEAWNTRQNALAGIERRGSFFFCDTHSPDDAEAFNKAEDFIYKARARTLQGVLAQLWVALQAGGGQIRNERHRTEQDIVRRADLVEVAAISRDLDYEQSTVFAAIQSLAAQIG